MAETLSIEEIRARGRRYYQASLEHNRARKRADHRRNIEQRLASAKKYRERNREKVRADNARWKAANPEKRREYVRASMNKQRYGVTRQHRQVMLEAQNYRCAICNVEQEKLPRRFHIDHDHKTGVVRGLVCHCCNHLLGNARDDVAVLRAAIAYLEKHNG